MIYIYNIIEGGDAVELKLEGDLLEFASFILRSRFHHDLNLRLTYLLLHSQYATFAQAEEALGVARSLFYRVKNENPALRSEKRVIQKWGGGGKENIFVLSEKALEYQELIKVLGEFHLGENECQKLRISAGKIRKGILMREAKYQRDIEMALDSLRKAESHEFNSRVNLWSRKIGISKQRLIALHTNPD
jgi:hypothetical protein